MKWFLASFICIVCAWKVTAQPVALDRLTETLDSLYLVGSYIDGEFLSRSLLLSNRQEIDDTSRATLELKLGMFQHELGKFAEAENAYLRARDGYIKSHGEKSPEVASVLSRLSVLFAEQGRYQDALEAARSQFAMFSMFYGRTHRSTALAGLALAVQFVNVNRMDSSRKLFDEFDDVILEAYGDLSKEAARLFEAKARTLVTTKKYAEADKFLVLARRASLVNPGDQHPLTARIALGLARVRLIVGEGDSALALANDALAISLKTRGPSHPFTAECHMLRGSALEVLGSIKEAFEAYTRGLETLRSATRENFRYTSERERLAFLDLVRDQCARITSSALRSAAIYPEASRTVYDALLFQKGIVVASLEALGRSSYNSGDTVTAKMLERIAMLRTRISRNTRGKVKAVKKFYSSQDSLQAEISSIEKELVRRSSTYRDLTNLLSARWQNITPALENNEYALELTRFPYYVSERKTDTVFYVALGLNAHDTLRPRLIFLGDARLVEDTSLIRQYYRSLEKKTKKASEISKVISSVLWTPLVEQLSTATSVIISPDGVFHQLAFAALPNTEGKLLIEQFAFQYVTSTRQLLTTSTESKGKQLALFAAPDYSSILEDKTLQPASMKELLRPLPETLVEADIIAEEFTKKNWDITRFVKQDATEAQLRLLRSPKILHIATHARFESPITKPSLADDRSSSL